MKNCWLNYGLTITLFACFLFAEIGLSVVGWQQHNNELHAHRQPTISYTYNVKSAEHFEST